jgi:hypothetical protein
VKKCEAAAISWMSLALSWSRKFRKAQGLQSRKSLSRARSGRPHAPQHHRPCRLTRSRTKPKIHYEKKTATFDILYFEVLKATATEKYAGGASCLTYSYYADVWVWQTGVQIDELVGLRGGGASSSFAISRVLVDAVPSRGALHCFRRRLCSVDATGLSTCPPLQTRRSSLLLVVHWLCWQRSAHLDKLMCAMQADHA